MSYRKKLIEVALPLEEINEASAREKSIRHGHPSTLHLWWARRPLATCRAVIFSQIVDDPGEDGAPKPYLKRIDQLPLHSKYRHLAAEDPVDAEGKPLTGEAAKNEKLARERRFKLFTLIEDLVQWENTTNEAVLEPARELIRLACDGNPPPLHDPFCGGGSIPLEAQRLGLEAYGSDLNPVAVLITKAMIEIPPKFANMPPINPEAQAGLGTKTWKGAQGLAEDVRYYGKWMRDEAEKRIGHLYPKVNVTEVMAADRPDLKPYIGRELTVIAWLWARTVKSPNPAFRDVDVPLASTFMLSTKTGKEAYVEPVTEGNGYRFLVKAGKPEDIEAAKNGTKVSRANFACLMSGTPISGDYIKAEGKASRMGARLMALVAEGDRGRVYLSPSLDDEAATRRAEPTWRPEGEIATRMTGGNCTPYGLTTWGKLFTDRQLASLTTFSDLIHEVRECVERDALAAAGPDGSPLISDDDKGVQAYAQAIDTYLAFAVDRLAMTGNSLVRWNAVGEKAQHCFGRQGLPMLWDYAEVNFFASATGSLDAAVFYSSDPLAWMRSAPSGHVAQHDASTQEMSADKIVCTDPPYYDNVGYADLSDFFYVWLRQSLKRDFPEQFATLAVPKAEELVAIAYRHGGREAAESFFMEGMTKAMGRLAEQAISGMPVVIYYAFKQSEEESESGLSSTGWETFLEAVLKAGFAIVGTWPMRTEMRTRQVAMSTNALASSIVIVCRSRTQKEGSITRREFQDELRKKLPEALQKLTQANVAPVDLAQASIGPGMEVFTRYSNVLEANGDRMSVKTALQLVNEVLAEVLEQQEGWYDPETRFAVTWFSQHGFRVGEFDQATVLSRARGTAPNALEECGFIRKGAGDFQLLARNQLPADYDPATDHRTTIWEVCQYLCRALDQGGEDAAARMMRRFRETKPDLDIDRARELAYRLYAISQKKSPSEARVYDALVRSWSEIETKSQSDAAAWQALAPAQQGLEL